MQGQNVQRVSFTRRFLDKASDPWKYVDEELPTVTRKVFAREKQGTLMDPGIHTPGTPLNMGSFQFAGSHHDFGVGSHSFRVIRRSVHIGSVPTYANAAVEWKLYHSRAGTIDTIPFFMGTQLANARRPRKFDAEAFGGPMNPLYVLGPGTVYSYFNNVRGSMRVYASLEGILS